jgi:hypothetical protein
MVFENTVLRRIFEPNRDEVMGGWRKLLNEELHDLYSPPSIIRIIKPRRIRWAGHVARIVDVENRIWLTGRKARRKECHGEVQDRREWVGWCELYWTVSA